MATDLTNGRALQLADSRPEIRRQYDMRDIEVMAKNAAASRMFGMDAAQAFTLMLIAQSEGLDPIQALKRYHVIQGRPAMRADAMQAEFQRQGGTVEWLSTTDAECKAIFRHPAQCPKGQLVSFDMADAKRAELGGKDNWRKYPAAMLRARVISMGVRMVLPGVVVGIYTPEEVTDFLPDDRGPVAAAVVLERPEGQAGFIHEPAHEPKSSEISEARAFIRDEITAAHDRLRATLAIEGKPEAFAPLAKEPQVAQALVSRWIADGAMEEKDIQKDKPNARGELVRDPAKVGAAVQVAWSQDPDDVKADVRQYLSGKEREALAAAGIHVAEDESQATADDD
jgi:hypothetical protein